MSYIAKRNLHYKSRFINPGQRVPADYPRLEEGIKRGWIVKRGDPAALPKPGRGRPKKIKELSVDIVSESTPILSEPRGQLITDLDYLNSNARESLADSGIIHVGDLIGWDAESLDALRGIGERLAQQLLEEFDKWESKNPDVEVDIGIEAEDGYDEDSDAGY